jgi:hypothetical protein
LPGGVLILRWQAGSFDIYSAKVPWFAHVALKPTAAGVVDFIKPIAANAARDTCLRKITVSTVGWAVDAHV